MLKVKFLSENSVSLEITGENLRDILILQRHEKFKSFVPLAFRTQSGALFCYDENIISYYVSSEEMSLSELVENSGCTALFRNTKELVTDDGFTVDPGYLWKQIQNHLILVNEDEYIEAEMNSGIFVKIL